MDNGLNFTQVVKNINKVIRKIQMENPTFKETVTISPLKKQVIFDKVKY